MFERLKNWLSGPPPKIVWPFDQPPDCVAVSLRSIMFGGGPIVYVAHDDQDGGGWQFLDSQEFDTSNAALVSLSTVVSHDPSVLEIADLPLGWHAKRASATDPWKRAPTAH